MATCSRCGVENKDGAGFCSACGAALGRMEGRAKPKDDCFGLPHGGAIFGLFIGALIILWGLNDIFGWAIDIGTYAIILVGLVIIAGAIYGLTRKRR